MNQSELQIKLLSGLNAQVSVKPKSNHDFRASILASTWTISPNKSIQKEP